MNRWNVPGMKVRTTPAASLAERDLRRWRCRTTEVVAVLGLTVVFAMSGAAEGTPNALSSAGDVQPKAGTEAREIFGWTVHVSKLLLATNAQATARALDLLASQLGEIVRKVPSSAVTELRKVPLWISPEYPGVNPRAEYHPNAD